MRLQTSETAADQFKRIVVRGTNWVGDAVITVPALRELRRLFPGAHITLVSRPGTADVFLDAEFVDEVLIYDRRGLRSVWNQIREWRKRQFDLAVIFQNAFEAAAIPFLARVPQRIGYDSEHRGQLLTEPVPLPPWKDERHESFYYLNLVVELGRLVHGTPLSESGDLPYQLDVSTTRRQGARDLLRGLGVETGTPFVVLCPGSINSRAKRWPADRYATLADQFIESGASVALIGSRAELDVSVQVRQHMRHAPIILTGKTTVAEATAIISVADVLIANDTGPAHIASAIGTPTVVIFGPTNPLTTRPFSPGAEIVRHRPDCAPCMLRDCPIDHRCMTAITADEVFHRARALMSDKMSDKLQFVAFEQTESNRFHK